MNEILKQNAFEPSMMDKSSMQSVLQGLLEQSEAEFGHKREVAAHSNELLTKYWYVKAMGVTESACSSEGIERNERLQGGRTST